MRARFRGIILLFPALLTLLTLLTLLSGCSVLGNCASRSASATPDAGTLTGDPVSIATDRTVYAPGDYVHVTLTNHYDFMIWIEGANFGCPLVDMQQLQGIEWAQVDVCAHPGQGDEEQGPPVGWVNAGQSVQVDLSMGNDNPTSDAEYPKPFPKGTFRAAVHYWWSDRYGHETGPHEGYIGYSDLFRVCSCRVCS